MLKDSGDRRKFESGAVRDMSASEKGRYDLIPPSPLQRLALIFQKGAVKYGEHNWQKGIPISSFLDSAMRHLQQVSRDLNDEDHAAQAAWNIFAMMWTLEQIDLGILPKELDDRKYKEPYKLENWVPMDGLAIKVRR
jgi:hypothetical protein